MGGNILRLCSQCIVVISLVSLFACAHKQGSGEARHPVFHLDCSYDVHVVGALADSQSGYSVCGAKLKVTATQSDGLKIICKELEDVSSKSDVPGMLDSWFKLGFPVDVEITPESGFPGMENNDALSLFVDKIIADALSQMLIRVVIEKDGFSDFEREAIVADLPVRENGEIEYDIGKVVILNGDGNAPAG